MMSTSHQSDWEYAAKDPIMNVEFQEIVEALKDEDTSPFVVLDVWTQEEID